VLVQYLDKIHRIPEVEGKGRVGQSIQWSWRPGQATAGPGANERPIFAANGRLMLQRSPCGEPGCAEKIPKTHHADEVDWLARFDKVFGEV